MILISCGASAAAVAAAGVLAVEKHRRTVDVMPAGREKMLNGHVEDASVMRAFVQMCAFGAVDARRAQTGRSASPMHRVYGSPGHGVEDSSEAQQRFSMRIALSGWSTHHTTGEQRCFTRKNRISFCSRSVRSTGRANTRDRLVGSN
jgi:hypothetical protein